MRTVTRTGRARVLLALPAALLLAGLPAGCASDAPDSSTAGAPAPARAPQNEAGGRAAAGQAGKGFDAGGGTTGQQARLPDAPAGTSVIYTADLRVRADRKGGVDDAAARAKQIVSAAGGHVATESSSTSPVRSNITFKIPADRYQATLDRLAGELGTRLSLRQEAEDVSGEVADVDSRVRSAEAALKSFRKLLARANTIGEVIQVEQEITRRQAELEALQARQESLRHRTRLATVTLTVQAPADQADGEDDDRGGFVGGLIAGWGAFTAFFTGLATVAGWLLPFLVLVAAVGVPVWLLRRRRRAAAPAPDGDAAG